MKTKICTECKEEKPLDDFYKDKRNKDGLQSKCKSCLEKYRKNNSEREKERAKKWRENNPERNKKMLKNYYENNKEKVSKKQKMYVKNNAKKVSAQRKEYRKNNIDKINNYRKNNAEKIHQKEKATKKERRKSDCLYKLTCDIRSAFGIILRKNGYKKDSKTTKILGCTFVFFKEYLESKFESWMNWENKGNPEDGILEPNKTWDIDHIIPLSTAKTKEDIIKLNHYTNLQPLCSYVNRYMKRDIY